MAGLFHLYEHMLFRGSTAHPGSSGVKAALASLGVSEWNGGTGAEQVDYWITLPSSEVARALAFWADTLISPTMDADALEAEKEVVIQEIRGRAADPDAIYEAALDKRLFAKYPWRRDPAGSEKAVRARHGRFAQGHRLDLVRPQQRGDFRRRGRRSRGSARRGGGGLRRLGRRARSLAKALPQNPRPGVVRPTWIVYPDPSMPEGIGRVEARYRGPDLAYDPVSSYAGRPLELARLPPEGRFKTALAANVPKLGGRGRHSRRVCQPTRRRMDLDRLVFRRGPGLARGGQGQGLQGAGARLRDHLDEGATLPIFRPTSTRPRESASWTIAPWRPTTRRA